MGFATFACDVGSTRIGADGDVKFGWAEVTEGDRTRIVRGDSDIQRLVESMRARLRQGTKVSLGVESPLVVPVPTDAAGLSAGRHGEGSRSCFAPAGGYVALLGLHQLAFILRSLKDDGLIAVFDPHAWMAANDGSRLLLWEAFVSDVAHCPKNTPLSGVRDAATAAVEFTSRMADGQLVSDVQSGEGAPVLSLAGAALLWAGWTEDVSMLTQSALVVRPRAAYGGDIALVT